jgi:RNA recognition motif-containing protein
VFFGAAEDVSEPTLLQLFSRHGNVTGLFLVRSALGLPSGCGYVTMANAEQAAAALEALQGSSDCAEEGGKLGLLTVQLPPEAQQQSQPQSPQQSQQPQSPQQQQKQQDRSASTAHINDVRTVSCLHQSQRLCSVPAYPAVVYSTRQLRCTVSLHMPATTTTCCCCWCMLS